MSYSQLRRPVSSAINGLSVHPPCQAHQPSQQESTSTYGTGVGNILREQFMPAARQSQLSSANGSSSHDANLRKQNLDDFWGAERSGLILDNYQLKYAASSDADEIIKQIAAHRRSAAIAPAVGYSVWSVSHRPSRPRPETDRQHQHIDPHFSEGASTKRFLFC